MFFVRQTRTKTAILARGGERRLRERRWLASAARHTVSFSPGRRASHTQVQDYRRHV